MPRDTNRSDEPMHVAGRVRPLSASIPHSSRRLARVPMLMNSSNQTRLSSPEVQTELLGRIETVLNERVRPGLVEDGGGVQVVGIDEDNIVQVRLLGACQACVSSVVTMTMFIEKAVKAEVPEVRFLEAIP